MFRLRRPDRVFLSTICLLLAAASAHGQETILQNDAFVDGQSAAFQGGFVAGGTAAVRLSPPGPVTMSVSRVQLLCGGATTPLVVTLRL